MHAITVLPAQPGSARLDAIPEPPVTEDSVLVECLAVGVCGTDVEIVKGLYGTPPPGRERLVLGHESIGRVLHAPEDGGFTAGDLVVGIVRKPDPVPCSSCAVGEWDMCRNGRYTEHGIKELDGFAVERFRISPEFLVRVESRLGHLGVLLEPTSVVSKAWEQIERIGARAHWQPKRVLVTGAGPIGLLAALLGVLRGFEVHVLDRVVDGPKPDLVKALGATYHTGTVEDAGGGPDIVLECTGAGQLVWDVMAQAAPSGIVCLTGVSTGGRTLGVDLGAFNREVVLQNNVVFGTVNANRRHYQAAADALAQADPAWLEQVITRRVPIEQWSKALVRQPHDVKTVIEFASL
ncbi:MAG TPA: glucose 1-dehydrogenase [Nitrospiraceae bacterium]|nr:glucose 1-dehydrogenase [Nitrospiraceae bacterium]